jgi:hypothetical protein
VRQLQPEWIAVDFAYSDEPAWTKHMSIKNNDMSLSIV